MSEEQIGNGAAADNGSAVELEEDFASLLEKSGSASDRLAPGQKTRAQVVSISGDLVYIDLGGKSEGVIDLAEFIGEDGTPTVQVGDEIEAFFVGVHDGIRRMTTLVNGYSAATLGAIREAFESGIPVTGEVRREVKGGFEVSVGGVRCFCPFSQIDLRGGREGGLYLGRTFPFKVIEYENNGRNVIVSRRVILDAERKERVAKLKESLAVGMDIEGAVKSVQNFGAFVDIGGIEGLIPASELSWDRAARPQDMLTAGQKVTVRIISLDWEKNRLALSLKATQPDPWAGVADRYKVDSRVSGTIVRLVPFGAFVRLEPGVEGLIHISNLGAGRRINHPKEVVEVGQVVEAYVLEADSEKRKVSLSIQPKPKPQPVVLPAVGEVFDGVVEKVMPYGIFVKLPTGMSGLVPNSEAGTAQGTDHKKMFPSGSEMKVAVIDVDKATAKVRLSRKAVMEKVQEAEMTEYRETVKSINESSSSGLGSLGDILRAKMEEKAQSGS